MNNPTTLTDPSGLGSQDACAMYFHLPSDQEHCPFNRVGALGCTIDGVNGDCGLARGLIAGGAALQCPSNVCEGVNGAGQVVSFHAFAGGGSGYYSYSGANAIYYSLEAAGKAGALAAWGASAKSSAIREYGGNIYADKRDGVYSYTQLQEGPVCDPSGGPCGVLTDSSLIPGGTELVGLYHDHPFGGEFSATDINTYLGPPSIFGFVSTSSDRVLMFDPIRQAAWLNSGASPPICVVAGPTLGIASCH